ncbi:MAG: SRPBCC domain-containing protein [Chitinophagaceae bacterium]|nr:SRPBCC domain-containing protein [Chitinophagaceae bacterium]
MNKNIQMDHYDWNQFVKRITIHVPPQTVYNAWSTAKGLESWFLRKAVFYDSHARPRAHEEKFQAGDNYLWLWYGYPDHVTEKKRILSVNGKDFLQFRFSGDCIVSINIKSENNETICELEQHNFPEDDQEKIDLHIGCSTGWTFYLANLKSILEGGIDLRNKNIDIEDVVNA